MSVTGGRGTYVVLDVQRQALSRQRYTTSRMGSRISKAKAQNAGASTGVIRMPSGHWILQPVSQDITRVISSGSSGFSTSPIGSADVNLAPGWATYDTFRKETDLLDMGFGSSIASTALPAHQKRVTAGATWNAKLTGDQTSFPRPVLDTEDIPMDRVIQGKVTYPANTPFAVNFSTPGNPAGMDGLLTFYFGGAAQTTEGLIAGQFALAIRGNGTAQLWERYTTGSSPWAKRMEFQYSANAQTGNLVLHTIQVVPYGRDHIAFFCGQADLLAATTPTVGPAAVGQALKRTGTAFYRSTRSVTGYTPTTSITGPGIIRMDARRDFRSAVTLIRMHYPGSGTLVDLPFRLPTIPPANTPLTLQLFGVQEPNGSTVDGTIYRADTNQPLTTDADGNFLSEAGVGDYYLVLDFVADTPHEQTPVLYGYAVESAGQTEYLAGLNITPSIVRSCSITGPDIQPDQDSARVSLEDPLNALTILGSRSRIQSQIRTTNTLGLDSVLFEGETAMAVRRIKGNTSAGYPAVGWSEWQVPLVGMWGRLADQLHIGPPIFYSEDPNADNDALWGGKPPWRVSDIIQDLLYRAGFPASQVNIDVNPIRLFGGDNGPAWEEMALQPGQAYAEMIRKLSLEYLGAFLVWDANAGASGQWRLIYNPTAPYTSLYSFVFSDGIPAGVMPMEDGAAGAWTAPVVKGSYRSHVEAPEGNIVMVVGAGGVLPSDGGPQQMTGVVWNPRSFNLDPGTPTATDYYHEDYLGRMVPLLYADPTLKTQQAVNFVARRIYDFACHARKWAAFQAPLVLVTAARTGDTAQTRPRPLRIGDGVTVQGSNAVIRSVNADYRKDSVQLAEYEVLFA